jgi:hypothetical protein
MPYKKKVKTLRWSTVLAEFIDTHVTLQYVLYATKCQLKPPSAVAYQTLTIIA